MQIIAVKYVLIGKIENNSVMLCCIIYVCIYVCTYFLRIQFNSVWIYIYGGCLIDILNVFAVNYNFSTARLEVIHI